ncbi:MAG: dTMP kinase [Chloroflexi bacterium]|nr:dTMP kinase [Chloroflexota bacterium]
MPQPLLITFEGGEATGKSTQVRQLSASLRDAGHKVVTVAEPGGTELGARLRRLVKFGQMPIGPRAEALLFVAARAQLVEEVMAPALADGAVVVSDRFGDSTLAYQGYGRGLDVEELRGLNAAATGGLQPDLTVLLDLPVDLALMRRQPRGGDRFEAGLAKADAADVAFHLRVREGFLTLAAQEPERWLVVNATLPRREVARVVRERVSGMLAE